jgi:N-dimethylarginine dimethylaminohydrolase
MSDEALPAAINAPATFGGPGWYPRGASHAEDLHGGVIWHSCGVDSEVKPLREVLLAWPGDGLDFSGPADEQLMLAKPDLVAIRNQARKIAEFYEEQGVTVHWARLPGNVPPNFIFQRDLFFMTPEGCILARPASPQRAAEARLAAMALASLGVPILGMPRRTMLFEGADALWLDASTVAIGVGFRTNSSGFEYVSGVLADMNIRTRAVRLPQGIQHLLGLVNLIDHDLAMIRKSHAGADVLGMLEEHGIRIISASATEEVEQRRAMNFVALRPRCVVMPSDSPETRSQLEAAGVLVFSLDVREYIKAAGALGCLTGILARG